MSRSACLTCHRSSTWIFPADAQIYGGAIPYTAALGHVQYGVPGSNPGYPSFSVDSDLRDVAVFLEHRIQFSPQWSLMYGLRGDLVQLNDSDPLYTEGAARLRRRLRALRHFLQLQCDVLPQSQYTAWYGCTTATSASSTARPSGSPATSPTTRPVRERQCQRRRDRRIGH